MEISIGVSNRHVHLTKEHLEVLFGKGFELKNLKNLHQPTNFVSDSFVTLKTEKDVIEHVRVLGELRGYTQIEISRTDAYKLGINPPVRDSGDLAGSTPITLVGPNGEVNLNEGCIIATRHIHITPSQMKEFGFEGKEEVSVKLPGEKGGIIDHVHLKVSELSYFELHLDTDDANAHLIKEGDIGEIL